MQFQESLTIKFRPTDFSSKRAQRMFPSAKLSAMTPKDEQAKAKAKSWAGLFLEEAKRYEKRGDVLNAMGAVEEGLRLSEGPFVIAERDELVQLKRKLEDSFSL